MPPSVARRRRRIGHSGAAFGRVAPDEDANTIVRDAIYNVLIAIRFPAR